MTNSRAKGLRRENEFVGLHEDMNVPARRISAMYKEGDDLLIEVIPGANHFTAEVKGRAAGAPPMKTLNKWRRHDPDLLFIKEDRQPPLVVLSWSAYERLLSAFERGQDTRSPDEKWEYGR